MTRIKNEELESELVRYKLLLVAFPLILFRQRSYWPIVCINRYAEAMHQNEDAMSSHRLSTFSSPKWFSAHIYLLIKSNEKKGWFRQIIVIISDRYLYLLWLKRIFLYINVYVFSLLAFINSNTGHFIFFTLSLFSYPTLPILTHRAN